MVSKGHFVRMEKRISASLRHVFKASHPYPLPKKTVKPVGAILRTLFDVRLEKQRRFMKKRLAGCRRIRISVLCSKVPLLFKGGQAGRLCKEILKSQKGGRIEILGFFSFL